MRLSHFRRVTRDGRWIAEVDGLRCVAIVSVVLFHMACELVARSGTVLNIEPRYIWLFTLIGNGDRGVRLFFVISGFILALPFARQFLLEEQAVSLRKFYLRRITRLEPPFLLSLVLATIMIGVYWRGWPVGFFTHTLASGAYLHSIIYHSPSWANSVTWSLELEIQFYLLAPLCMQLLRIRPPPLRRGLLLAAMVVCGILQVKYLWDTAAVFTVAFYAQYFLAGLLLADIFTLEMKRMAASWWWDAVSCVGWLAVFTFAHDWRPAHAILPFLFVLLCLAAFKSKGLRKVFANPWIATCGGMCYSIYLMHFVLIAMIFKATQHAIVFPDFLANYVVQIVVTVVPMLVMCSVFYLLVEHPCMDPAWPSKLWMRLRGVPSREAQAWDATGIGR